MCSKVIAGDEVITTAGELAAFLGGEHHLVADPNYQGVSLDACLCQVDIAATMLAAGRTGRFTEWNDYYVAG